MHFPQNIEELKTASAYHSTYIENILRHRMVAELSSELWQRNCNATLQIFNSEVDDAGFDLVIKLNSAVRYVQLKQAHDGKTPAKSSTRASFSLMTGSCIVLIAYKLDDLSIAGYRFFGNRPHEPMPVIDGYKASKSPGRRNSAGERHIRPHYRDVRVSQFTKMLSALDLLDVLFPDGQDFTLTPTDDTIQNGADDWDE